MLKNSFILYHDYAEHFELLTDAELGQLLRAIMLYETDRITPDFNGALKMAFSFIKVNLDRDREKWEKKIEQNKKNGAKGGRPKEDNLTDNVETQKSERLFQEPKKAVNDNDTVTDNDKRKNIKKEKPVVEKTAFAEFVSMTNDEHSSLVTKYGEGGTKRLIEILDNYKGSSGKTYNSDYRAILNWVVDRYTSEKAQSNNGLPDLTDILDD